MDPLKQIASFAESISLRLADQAGTIDPRIFVTILIILVLFATVSRSLLNFLGATLLALVGFLILIAPASATTLIAISAGLGSLLITLAGIRSRRFEAIASQRFDGLSHALKKLELVQERQFLGALNSQSREARPSEESSLAEVGATDAASTKRSYAKKAQQPRLRERTEAQQEDTVPGGSPGRAQ
jgi:hypothetical protein